MPIARFIRSFNNVYSVKKKGMGVEPEVTQCQGTQACIYWTPLCVVPFVMKCLLDKMDRTVNLKHLRNILFGLRFHI